MNNSNQLTPQEKIFSVYNKNTERNKPPSVRLNECNRAFYALKESYDALKESSLKADDKMVKMVQNFQAILKNKTQRRYGGKRTRRRPKRNKTKRNKTKRK